MDDILAFLQGNIRSFPLRFFFSIRSLIIENFAPFLRFLKLKEIEQLISTVT